MRLAGILAASIVLIALPGMAIAGPKTAALAVRDPVIRPAAAGGTTAAYLTLFNATARPLKLAKVTCACAAEVMAHRSSEQGGMAHMAPAGDVIVPPHGRLDLAPGGLHLMVTGLKRPIKLGDHLPMQMSFTGMATITVSFTAAR